MMKRFISLSLSLLLCITFFAGTGSISFAEEEETEIKYCTVVGEASGWIDTDDDKRNQSSSQTQQTTSAPAKDPFADIAEKETLDAKEAYVNQTVVTDNQITDLLGMSVYLTGISRDGDGNVFLKLKFKNDHGSGLQMMMEVAVAVGGNDEDILRNEISFIGFPVDTYDEANYIVSNPDLQDMTVRISMFVQEIDREDTRKSRTVILPIHLMGDYLTDAPKGEIHLPVPDGDNAEFSVYDTTPLFSNEQLTVQVTSVTIGPDEGLIGLAITTTLDEGSLSLFMIDMSINGMPGENYGWNGIGIPVKMPEGKLPVPMETISFTLGAAGDGIDGIWQSDRFTLVFDGIGVKEKEDIPEEEPQESEDDEEGL